ncbi:hypothetical protein HXX76_005086 [Chlamydomonas incerta]|uniref:Elongation factor P n=1 Tax=Chlamydomonas incerta TaxID=51695 RepID=A0A835W408_CHLIN|nr:hypothetical protein HXX76_005086 [Chlamydomonas incerta]|eukprot:KAG2438535.1 hypothetical protein HXX76_005086 [Chlamydomonas incerta]
MHGQARAAGFVMLDLVDLASGARTSEKLRLEDQVEVADVEEKGMQVLYQDEAGVHVMDSSTYEQSVLSPDLFGEGRRWVASSPELEVEVAFFQGEPVAARVPHKLSVKVLDAPPAVVKADGSSARHVVVAGGVSVMAPAFVKTGDTIVVRTEDASYMAKAT